MPGKKTSNSFMLTVKPKDGTDAETYEIVFTEAWASVSTDDKITARLRGYAYKVTGGTRTPLAGAKIRYGYIIDDDDTYADTTTDNEGYFSEDQWFDGDEYGSEGYGKGSETIFAAIIVYNDVVCAQHILMVKEAEPGKQGPTGPTGPEGPTGPAGPAGPAGSTGKMCYIAGPYSSSVEYTSNSQQTVAVEVEGSSAETVELWYLTASTNVVNGVHIAPTDSNQTVWEQALNDYNMIRTKYLFADFAQLGSFVVSKDFFFSQHGTLFAFGDAVAVTSSRTVGKVYLKTVNGKQVPYYAAGSNSSDDRPCYTFFNAADPMAEDVQNGPSFTLEGNGISNLVMVRRVWFVASAATTVTVTISPSTEASYDVGALGELDASELSADGVTVAKVKSGSVPTLIKTSGTTQSATTVDVSAGLHFFEIAYLKDASVNGNNDDVTFTFSASSSYIAGFSMISFRPMKAVNAFTGEEWGAGGNFEVSASGDVRVNGVVRAKSMETTFADLTDKYRKDGSSYVALDGGTGNPGEYILGEDVYELVNGSYVKCDISGIYNFVVGNTVFFLPSDSQYISQRVLLFNGNMDTSGGTSKGPRVMSCEYDEGLTTTRYLRGIGKEVIYNSNNSSVPSNHVLPSGSAVPVWSFDAVTSLFFVNGAVELIAVPDTEDATLCEWAVVNIGTNCYMID